MIMIMTDEQNEHWTHTSQTKLSEQPNLHPLFAYSVEYNLIVKFSFVFFKNDVSIFN